MGRDWYALTLFALLMVSGCSGRASKADAEEAAATPRVHHKAPAAKSARSARAPNSTAAAGDTLDRAREIEVSRETFAYQGAARDPFNSLVAGNSSGPELADLQLVGIYENLRTPSNSVIVLREKVGDKRHKLRTGDRLGRLRLAEIRPREAVFMVQDLGSERQETLSLRKQQDVTP